MFQDLFNVRVTRRPTTVRFPGGGGDPGAGAGDPGAVRQGTFVTPQSLTSFAGASGAVLLMWRGLGAIRPGWGSSGGVAFVCALIIGTVVFAISETDPKRGPMTSRDYFVDGVVALLNVLVLFSAAVGGTQMINAGGPSGKQAEVQHAAPLGADRSTARP